MSAPGCPTNRGANCHPLWVFSAPEENLTQMARDLAGSLQLQQLVRGACPLSKPFLLSTVNTPGFGFSIHIPLPSPWPRTPRRPVSGWASPGCGQRRHLRFLCRGVCPLICPLLWPRGVLRCPGGSSIQGQAPRDKIDLFCLLCKIGTKQSGSLSFNQGSLEWEKSRRQYLRSGRNVIDHFFYMCQ